MSRRSADIFEYVSPLSLEETWDATVTAIRVTTAAVAVNGEPIFMDYEHIPPLAASIYFSTVEDDRIVVTAGHRSQTYWQMFWDLKQLDDGGVYGKVTLDRPIKRVNMWIGDVQQLWSVSMRLHRMYGFQIIKCNFW